MLIPLIKPICLCLRPCFEPKSTLNPSLVTFNLPSRGLQLNSFKNQYKKDVRDKSLRDDIRLILKELPENAIVSIDFQKHNIIHGYFARYENISLDTDRGNQHKYLISFEDGWSYEASKKISSISNKNTTGEYLEKSTSFQWQQRKRFKKNYTKIELNTNKLHLYIYKK